MERSSMFITRECLAITVGGDCPGRMSFDLTERYDGMVLECPVCRCEQMWLADQEKWVAHASVEPPDLYGIHGR